MTIIAILTLILVPIVRNRVEEAKIVAARDDMWTIEKAQSLAYAYTGHHFRLQDLTVGESDDVSRMPLAYWDREMTANQRLALVPNWKGPFMSPPQKEKRMTVLDLYSLGPDYFRGPNITEEGPIFYLGDGGTTPHDDDDDYHPLDPWGSPYLFFGAGSVDQSSGGIPAAVVSLLEETYSTAAVYCMGADGLPGEDGVNPLTPNLPEDYWRTSSYLGLVGDDLYREF